MICKASSGKAPRRGVADEKIFSALLLAMEETPLHMVKVAPLCHVAGINRSTFYARYAGVAEAVEACEDDLCARLSAVISAVRYAELTHEQVCREYLDFFVAEAPQLRILLTNERGVLLGDRIEGMLCEHFLARVNIEIPSKVPYREEAVRFVTAGFWRLYLDVVFGRVDDLDAQARLAAELCSAGLNGYLAA